MEGDFVMADLVAELANQCGISPDLARQGLGTLLSFFKDKLSPETYSQISSAIGTCDLEATADACEGSPAAASSGGLMGAIGDMASKLLGGGEAGELVSKLTKQGFTPDQLATFLPSVLQCLKGKLSDDQLKQIEGLVPTPELTAH